MIRNVLESNRQHYICNFKAEHWSGLIQSYIDDRTCNQCDVFPP